MAENKFRDLSSLVAGVLVALPVIDSGHRWAVDVNQFIQEKQQPLQEIVGTVGYEILERGVPMFVEGSYVAGAIITTYAIYRFFTELGQSSREPSQYSKPPSRWFPFSHRPSLRLVRDDSEDTSD